MVANNDDAGGNHIDLNNVVNLKKLDINVTFTNELRCDDWANTDATEFDFSGITSTQGTQLNVNDAGNRNFAGNIVYKGSAGADIFEGILGFAPDKTPISSQPCRSTSSDHCQHTPISHSSPLLPRRGAFLLPGRRATWAT